MPEHAVGLASLGELAATFEGQLIRPDDSAYDEARKVWNGLYDRRPALVARCASDTDVIAALAFAKAENLPIAVRGGGHSAVGYGTINDGIVIDMSAMTEVIVDPIGSTARAQAGATWGDFDAATQEHGLAVTGGRFSTTGIAGLTLGSGSGWLERKCGLTADSLISAEMVTADGRLVTASEDENPDLFWGLRGGGGNFGVVTSFTYRLHRVGPIVYGGVLISTPDRAGAILRFMREHMPTAPDDLGMALAFMSAPPEPFVPPEFHFAPVVGTVVCWTGDHAAGQTAIEPLREAAQPVIDLVEPIPYTALQSLLDGGGPKGVRGYMKAEFMTELSDVAITKLIEHGMHRAGPMTQLLLEPMGGAIARVDEEATALGRRDVPWCYHALALWMEPDEATADAHVTWARKLTADMAPHTTEGVYLNYTSDMGDERVRSAYGPEKYDRLVALKDKYDPGNLFRMNQNIPPSAKRG